jgi:hypothetical protein
MKNINLYADTAAYVADANRPIDESTVSHILDGSGTKFEGKNILVDKPGAEIGDILVFDKTTSLKKFIKASTLDMATLPVSIVTIGVVYHRQGDKVFIAAKTNATAARWAQGFRAKLYGFNFSTGGTFNIQINGVNSPAVVYTNEDTISSLSNSVESALNSGADDTIFKHWSVSLGPDYIAIERNRHTPIMEYIFLAVPIGGEESALQLTGMDYQTVLSGLFSSVYANISRNDGTATSYAGMNYEKFYQYYYGSGSTDTNQAVGAAAPVRYSVYNETDNPIIVAYYGGGEAGYANYLQDKMIKHPYGKNAILDDNGQLNTNLLAAVTFIDADGSTKPAYPAANNCKIFTGGVVAGYVTGLEVGAWWLPSVREMNFLTKDRRLDLLDKVNLSLSAIGGTAVNPGVSHWPSSERSSNNAWFYSGSIGTMYGINKSNSYSVRPVTAF